MTEPSGSDLETLWEDEEFVLSRGVREGEPSPLLVVAPAAAQPARGSHARLEHAYALRDELDSAYAARPLRLARDRGRPTLVLEDPGGEPLARLLGRPWAITPFLRVASAWRPRRAGSTSGASSTRTSSRPMSSSTPRTAPSG
jgi:hypothetical protein